MAQDPVVCAVAGNDPSGGSGLAADLQACWAAGVHGCGVITTVTVQGRGAAGSAQPVAAGLVRRQLEVVLAEYPAAVVKTGALVNKQIVSEVLDVLETRPETRLVVDPVLASSDGLPLYDARERNALDALYRRAVLVTPNLPEAEFFMGCRLDVSQAQLAEAAMALADRWTPVSVLLKGGHAEGARVRDCLVSDGQVTWFEDARIAARMRGTGCRLASAVAAHLARGSDLQVAISEARGWLRTLLEAQPKS